MTKIVEVLLTGQDAQYFQVKSIVDNQKGIIHRRELTWNRSVRIPKPSPSIGDRFQAVIIDQGHGTLELSVKRSIDPWENVARKYAYGDIVRGEVVNVLKDAVYVQIEPGVDARIFPSKLPLRNIGTQLPKDVLSVGDFVQGVVKSVDHERRLIEMDVMDNIRRISLLSEDQHFEFLRELFPVVSELTEVTLRSAASQTNQTDEPESPQHLEVETFHDGLGHFEKVLLVDDTPTFLDELCVLIRQNFDCQVDCCDSYDEALQNIHAKGEQYDLAIFDLHLGHRDGSQLVKELFDQNGDAPIILMSRDSDALDKVKTIPGQRLIKIVREKNTVVEQVERLISGYIAREKPSIYLGGKSFADQLGMSTMGHRTLGESIQPLLARLKVETGTTYAMLIEANQVSQEAWVANVTPELDAEVLKRSRDNLFFSPVRNVIETGLAIYEHNLDHKSRRALFRHLFPLLDYKAFLAIPVIRPDVIPDIALSFALFLFENERTELPPSVEQQAVQAGYFIGLALERAVMMNFMARFQQRYIRGNLLMSFVHELEHPITLLEKGGAKVRTVASELLAASTQDERKDSQHKAIRAVEDIEQQIGKLATLMKDYTQLVHEITEPVDVNAVVRKVISQYEGYSRPSRSFHLSFIEDTSLPLAQAISTRVEQVLVNVVLNALQQFGQQADRMSELAQQQGESISLLQEGAIEVETRYVVSQPDYPIQIIVRDSGPGIHYYQQSRIFQMGITTRKGPGLGLFISRNLLSSMKGRIRLLDSIMYVGSVFAIELHRYPGE